MRDELISDGYTLDFHHEFALPVFVWELELHVRGVVELSASERAVLRLAGAGLGTTELLASALGFGTDVRLVADAATRMLGRGGLAIAEGRLVLTSIGSAMLATASLVRRDQVRQAVYFRPVEGQWSWRRPDRMPTGIDWTVDWRRLVVTPNDAKDRIADLVGRKGVPTLADRAVCGVAKPVELVTLHEGSASTAHEQIAVERWTAPDGGDPRFLGFRDGECDARLTEILASAQVDRKRKRLRVGMKT